MQGGRLKSILKREREIHLREVDCLEDIEEGRLGPKMSDFYLPAHKIYPKGIDFLVRIKQNILGGGAFDTTAWYQS